MTERLAADPAGVSVLAAQVADETGIPAAHVEKDFWVTEVLRGVVASASNAQVVVVFKGGTSLSKAYRLIERFRRTSMSSWCCPTHRLPLVTNGSQVRRNRRAEQLRCDRSERSVAGDRDGQGGADLGHAAIAEAADPIDEHTDRNALDGVQIDR